MIELKPSVWIGKGGLGESQIKEIKDQLSRKKLIKIKLLRSALDGTTRSDIAEEISKKSGGEVVDLTGLVITLQKGARNGR